MKIRRYLAKDMRNALKQVRDEQGPEAVIMSSRRIGDSVEVVAAVDYEMESQSSDSRSADEFNDYRFAGSSDLAGWNDVGDDSAAASGYSPYSQSRHHDELESADFALQGGSLGGQVNAAKEIHALRRMLETQLAALAWNDLTRRSPVHTEVLRELSRIGIAADLASELATQLPDRIELQAAVRLALGLWSHRIPIGDDRWLARGGTVALVGPTGVGKTSTLAKLAARWVLQHGPRDLVLISADSVRIGAQEQVQSIGRLLGVPSIAVDSITELSSTLSEWEHRKFVLIDTPGANLKDPKVAAEYATLSVASNRLETSLVLSASSQAGAIEESLLRFAAAQPKSCVLTKLDEAVSLGGAVSAIIRTGLPLHFVCEGQRLAEDIKPARAHHLVARAVQLARANGAATDEDLLSRRFGGIAHALA
jgi:flagellar biosynthesis protein FlhF